MRTVAPLTVTNGRVRLVPGTVTGPPASHADAPRGSRQKCSVVVLGSLPIQAMYAVPEGSTATSGSTPGPIATVVAARPSAGVSARASSASRASRAQRSFIGASLTGVAEDRLAAPARPPDRLVLDRERGAHEQLDVAVLDAAAAAVRRP